MKMDMTFKDVGTNRVFVLFCPEHGTELRFTVDWFTMQRPDINWVLARKVDYALKNCPSCLEKDEYASTRWPEGAEI